MMPGIIRGDRIRPEYAAHVVRWMESNGLRHYVPSDAHILIHGGRFTVETLDIERTPEARIFTTRTHGKQWSDWDSREEIPRKVRTYRIRHELADIR